MREPLDYRTSADDRRASWPIWAKAVVVVVPTRCGVVEWALWDCVTMLTKGAIPQLVRYQLKERSDG